MHTPTVLTAMQDLLDYGVEQSPRGQKTLEIMNYQFEVNYPFTSFTDRKFDIDYLKKEMLWYIDGNPFNEDIMKASKQWEKFRQPDGQWFSCYGQYWFKLHVPNGMTGVDWVVNQLTKDKDSRQAIIPMLQPKHLFESNVDVVCTSYVNFHIRDEKLLMTVRMRSSDIIWGYGNDLPCFWWLHDLVATRMGIEKGVYTHSSDSLHVYEKHFDMARKIASKGMKEFYEIEYPKPQDNYFDFIEYLKDHNG